MPAELINPRPFQYTVQHMQDAVRRDGTACGRGEDILGETVFPFLLGFQDTFQRMRQLDVMTERKMSSRPTASKCTFFPVSGMTELMTK